MSKTKYIKVDVSERLPEKYGFYFVIMKSGVKKNFWFNGEKFFLDKDTRDILYWLEEIPDREEEMIEMLEKVYPLLYERHLYETANQIKSLLQSLKQ